ncbi:MAG: rod shape-determining protein MreC [Bacilli bacterium]|nr:rod shape-determining protein MreC [Bacilli bacterium]
MYKKKKHSKYKKGGIIITLVLFFVIGSVLLLNGRRNLTPIEMWVKDSILFFQKMVLKPFHLIENNGTNQSLKEQVFSYESLEAKNKELENQLRELKKTLTLNTALSDQSYLNATVINRKASYWNHLVTLDKGKKSGIKNDLPVVVSEGLIGFTSDVSNFSSSVKLLTMEELSKPISVKIEVGEHYIYGLLSGYDYNDSVLKVEGIAENTEIPKGSLVTTSGLGENIPAGIIVGYVKNITSDNFDLARVVEVESKVNFDALSYVTILKRGDLES